MRSRLACGMVLLLAAWILSGCTMSEDITAIRVTTYLNDPSRQFLAASSGTGIIKLSDAWSAWNSAVLLEPVLPRDVDPADIASASIEIPVIPLARRDRPTEASRFAGAPYLSLAAYRVMDPAWEEHIPEWLTVGEPAQSAYLMPSTGRVQGLVSRGNPTEYSWIRFDITDIVQAWYQGEPNYGLVSVPLPMSERTETSGWKYTQTPPVSTAFTVIPGMRDPLELKSRTDTETMTLTIRRK